MEAIRNSNFSTNIDSKSDSLVNLLFLIQN